MLRRLQNRLRMFLIVIFMAVISLLLGFSFWNTWQARQTADITYIQRMASLMIYQLEADPANPEELLSNYESEMNVYSILKDAAGHVLFQSDPDTVTDFAALGKLAENSIEIQSPARQTASSPITEQGGYGVVTGSNQDHYYVIPASISTRSGNWYSLVLFYQQPSPGALVLRQAPSYGAIWLLALACILFVSRFLLRRAFEPTEQVLQSQKDFVAAASHELKSPLAVIMANAENLQNFATTAPQIQQNLHVIDAECARMSRLIRDMLLLASSDADKWTIRTQEVNIDTLLITLYEAYEPVCRKKGFIWIWI